MSERAFVLHRDPCFDEIKPTGLILPTAVRAALATLPGDFTGKIELNCFKGGVGNINIHWSVKTD